MIIDTYENKINWLDGFKEEWLPSNVLKDIRLVRSGSRVGLEIGDVAGAVKLNDGNTLHVHPKVGRINLLRMLFTCEGLYDRLKHDFRELATYGIADEQSATQIIIRSFVQELRSIKKRSLRFDYERVLSNGASSSGEIMPLETQLRVLQQYHNPIRIRGYVRQYDTPENRVLGHAARVALRYANEQGEDYEELRHWSTKFASSFTAHDMHVLNNLVVSGKEGGSRGYYGKALTLARIVLGGSGITTNVSHPVEADSILLRTSALYEAYLRAVLVRRYSEAGIVITKGGGISKQTLYLDGSFELEPDYVFEKGNHCLLVADAKYKSPSASDHYQLVCYLTRYAVKTGILIIPCWDKNIPSPVRRVTNEGKEIWEYSIPLFDLDLAEELIGEILKTFAHH